jgi:hypothetical protein
VGLQSSRGQCSSLSPLQHFQLQAEGGRSKGREQEVISEGRWKTAYFELVDTTQLQIIKICLLFGIPQKTERRQLLIILNKSLRGFTENACQNLLMIEDIEAIINLSLRLCTIYGHQYKRYDKKFDILTN